MFKTQKEKENLANKNASGYIFNLGTVQFIQLKILRNTRRLHFDFNTY